MKNEYDWMRQRYRDKRQELRDEDDLDDRLEDGFSLMADDDDEYDSSIAHLSSRAERDDERRKKAEL